MVRSQWIRRVSAACLAGLVCGSVVPPDSHHAHAGGESAALRVELKSPTDGTIIEADATAGEFVAHDHSLFHVVNLDRLFIEAHVSEFDLAVRVNNPGAIQVQPIQRLPVCTASGAVVPLEALAKIRRDRGSNQISRENVQRKIVISCNAAARRAGQDRGRVISEIATARCSWADR